MEAIVLQNYSPDGFKHVENLPVPALQESSELINHGVLIRVKACALSSADVRASLGNTTVMNPPTPFTIGYEVSGVVESVGALVTSVKVGDCVVAYLPTDQQGGCCERIATLSSNVVVLPAGVSHDLVAASLQPGIRAHSALHYALHAVAGEMLLVFDAAGGDNHLAVQMAGKRGLRVLAVAQSDEERAYLSSLGNHIVRIINPAKEDLYQVVLAETGGLGVDAVLDAGRLPHLLGTAQVTAPEGSRDAQMQAINTIIQCLAAHGRWASSLPMLQLDPPEAEVLRLKGASLSFVNEQAWVLSGTQMGRFLHILTDVVEQVSKRELVPHITTTVQLTSAESAAKSLARATVGRTVVLMQRELEGVTAA